MDPCSSPPLEAHPNVLAWPNRIKNSFKWQAIHTESFPLASCERHTLLETRKTPTTEVTERPLAHPGHVRLATQRESSHAEERHRNSSTRMTKAIITQHGVTLDITKSKIVMFHMYSLHGQQRRHAQSYIRRDPPRAQRLVE